QRERRAGPARWVRQPDAGWAARRAKPAPVVHDPGAARPHLTAPGADGAPRGLQQPHHAPGRPGAPAALRRDRGTDRSAPETALADRSMVPAGDWSEHEDGAIRPG